MGFGVISLGENQNRRTVRQPTNPLDKSTIVSILPKRIVERKCTLNPGLFEIAPGSPENPSILVVESSSWWKETGENEPLLEITNGSVQVANSIVHDYCNGLLACNMGDQMPGLFWVAGAHTVTELKESHPVLFVDAERKQRKWFMELIKMADILWSRSNGNPLSISDDARMGCKILNITNKPWLGDIQTAELVPCLACGALRNAKFPICQTCKAIVDKDLAKKLDLVFAQ